MVGVPPFKAISLVLISFSVTASVSRFQGEISLVSSQGRILTVRVELFQQLFEFAAPYFIKNKRCHACTEFPSIYSGSSTIIAFNTGKGTNNYTIEHLDNIDNVPV